MHAQPNQISRTVDLHLSPSLLKQDTLAKDQGILVSQQLTNLEIPSFRISQRMYLLDSPDTSHLTDLVAVQKVETYQNIIFACLLMIPLSLHLAVVCCDFVSRSQALDLALTHPTCGKNQFDKNIIVLFVNQCPEGKSLRAKYAYNARRKFQTVVIEVNCFEYTAHLHKL